MLVSNVTLTLPWRPWDCRRPIGDGTARPTARGPTTGRPAKRDHPLPSPAGDRQVDRSAATRLVIDMTLMGLDQWLRPNGSAAGIRAWHDNAPAMLAERHLVSLSLPERSGPRDGQLKQGQGAKRGRTPGSATGLIGPHPRG